MITNQLPRNQESEKLLKQITNFEDKGHYFNSKYYESKRLEIVSKNTSALKANLANESDAEK